MQLNAKIAETLANIYRQYPEFVEWLEEDRVKSLELLEGTGDDVIRGGCLKLKELLQAFKSANKR